MTLVQARFFAMASFAMVAFAANSLLARLALSETGTDPAAFSVARLVSGAMSLWFFVVLRDKTLSLRAGSWWSATALFGYGVAFSYAYLQLSAGAGALILFGTVQATMLGFGWVKGDRFNVPQWAGFVLACLGVGLLLSPGVTAPARSGALLMTISGVGWGVYSLRGGGVGDPVATSAGNFMRTLPMCLVLVAVAFPYMNVDGQGLVYALLSGIITSGLGYIVWYKVVPRLSVVNASTIQLSVPALAAIMGILVLGEPVTQRLILADIAVLVGISVVLRGGRPQLDGEESV